MSLDYILTKIIDDTIDLKQTFNQFLTHTIQIKEFETFIRALATLSQPKGQQLYEALRDSESKLTLVDSNNFPTSTHVFNEPRVPKSQSQSGLNKAILINEATK